MVKRKQDIIKGGSWKKLHLPPNEDPEFAFLSGFEEMDCGQTSQSASPSKLNEVVADDKKRVKKKKKKSKDTSSKEQRNVENEGGKKDEAVGQPSADDQNDSVDRDGLQGGRKKYKEASWTMSDPCDKTGSAGTSSAAWVALDLPQPLLQGLASEGLAEPTEIQSAVIPLANSGKDILGAAETGSGKTLAFGLPILRQLLSLDAGTGGVRCLILTPTRELAIQIKHHLRSAAAFTNIKIVAIVGGLSVDKQRRLLRNPTPHIVVATPGRFWQLLSESAPELSNLPETMTHLVVDETDRMLETGHFAEVEKILEFLSDKPLQKLIFSATLTFVHKTGARGFDKPTMEGKVERLATILKLHKNYKVVDLTKETGTAGSVSEAKIVCKDLLDKDTRLYQFLLQHPGRTLVFANSIDASRRLHAIMQLLKLPVFPLHAKMHQKQRLKNLERFAGTSECVLLASDVAARGLDIRNIQHVVHYQVPRTTEVYVHRSGRTGRANRTGLSVMLVDEKDTHYYRRICINLNRCKLMRYVGSYSRRFYVHSLTPDL